MLSKNQKRFLVSYYIWHVNHNIFGNTFRICFILSTTTFLIIFTPFEIYFSFRDIWFKRWIPIHSKYLKTEKIKIKIGTKKSSNKPKFLYAELIFPKNKEKIKAKNAIIVVCHGFSDTKITLQNYYLPLAYNGYVVLAYDARGIGKSKKAGKRNQLLLKIQDFKKIIKWIKNDQNLSKMSIFCVGFSIGAITVLSGGFLNEDIKKIIAISSISNYKENIPRHNLLILISYFIKGVILFPNEEENFLLSPYLIIEKGTKTLSKDLWKKLAKRVMLIHAKNDKVIKLKNFLENKEILETPKEFQLLFNKGGHSLKKNELSLVGASLSYFNS
jgi:predicted esterase